MRVLYFLFVLLSLGLLISCGDDEPRVKTIYLYDAGTYNGNLKGSSETARLGADCLCAAAKPSVVPLDTVHAFISIDATDTIAAMPDNF